MSQQAQPAAAIGAIQTWTHDGRSLPGWLHPWMIGRVEANGTFLIQSRLGRQRVDHGNVVVEQGGDVYAFYSGLGLRAFGTFPGLAIIELRGGTHLLLMQKDDAEVAEWKDSRNGQRPDYEAENIDLMIAGRTKEDLEHYRTTLIGRGYQPSLVSDEELYYHYHFSLLDPDGHGVTFYTNHCSDRPV